jgi:hypothetical protein
MVREIMRGWANERNMIEGRRRNKSMKVYITN